MRTLLKETAISKLLTVGAKMESDEVGLFIASRDVSCGCGFRFGEWEKFVECVNIANENYLKSKNKSKKRSSRRSG